MTDLTVQRTERSRRRAAEACVEQGMPVGNRYPYSRTRGRSG